MTIKKHKNKQLKTRNYLAMDAYMRNGGGPHKDKREKNKDTWKEDWLDELDEDQDESDE